MSCIKFGIIGCGVIADFHAKALEKAEGGVLCGVSDASPERSAEFAKKYSARAYPSVESMLGDGDIDAVCICVPSGFHASVAINALSHGKHVLIEKPLAISNKDCDAVIAVAEKTQKCAGVISQLRFSPDIQTARRLIYEGRLGKIVTAELSMKYFRPQSYYDSSAWRGTWALDGGSLENQGIHGVDIMLYLMGGVKSVFGYAPDPRRPDAIGCLKSAVDMYGVSVCGEIKLRMMYDNPDAIDMFRYCGDAGLPVTLHFDYPEAQLSKSRYPRRNWWYGGGIDCLERVLIACPKTNFLGHAPGFWGHISNDDLMFTSAYPTGTVIPGGEIERLLGKYPNLYCDISAGSVCRALSRDLDYTYKLMTRFPDRFLYARDYFDNIHQELIEKLNLPQDVRELIYHGNAERLVKS